jgi:hypothetical protein
VKPVQSLQETGPHVSPCDQTMYKHRATSRSVFGPLFYLDAVPLIKTLSEGKASPAALEKLKAMKVLGRRAVFAKTGGGRDGRTPGKITGVSFLSS